MGQIAVWNVESVIGRFSEIRAWFWTIDMVDPWMLNIIDIQHNCNYFVCDNRTSRENRKSFYVQFKSGIAKTSVSYLRKEIIKNDILGPTFNWILK